MRIYLQPPQPSRGLQRIADALVRYLPEGWEVTNSPSQSDLIVVYAIGRRNSVTDFTKSLGIAGKKYAVVQVCLRSTLNPDTRDWEPLWENAEVVWSYYDLHQAVASDQNLPLQFVQRAYINFYHSPLGADAEVFKPSGASLKFTIATSGLSRLSESVRECHLAVKAINGRLFHLGPDVLRDDLHVTAMSGISDETLAWRYSECEFVSGLRRKEGFELPAVEGLLCGARPICFKGADWEFNYGSHAIYIEETDRQGVIDQLVPIFKHGAPPVTPEERERAVERYDWKRIIGGFYNRLR